MDNLKLATVYARNCEVRRVEKPVSSAFLSINHRLGDASDRYRYGLFVKRCTGKSEAWLEPGTLVAVASFSNARRWKKENGTVASYEWIRYASLPEIRVVGGMGKLLQAFVDEIHPDDVMTYCDLRWSAGDAYRELGFELEGIMEKPEFSCAKFRLRIAK